MIYIFIGLLGSAIILAFLGLAICMKRDQKNYTPVSYSIHPYTKTVDNRSTLGYQNYYAQPCSISPPSYTSIMAPRPPPCRNIPPNQPRLVIPKPVITT